MAEYSRADIYLWGDRVGRVIEGDQDGRRIFQYDPDFAGRGLEISPINLPTSDATPRAFAELARSTAFEGLPGVVADSLPDRFGTALIQAHFDKRTGGAQVTPIQKLLYVGQRGPGALEYRPAAKTTPEVEQALEVRDLVDQARRVIEGDTREAIAEIISVGATVGGARPKALILWNRKTNRVRSGHARPQHGDEHWIVKFDGVTKSSGGLENRVTHEPGPWGRLEYAYSTMARQAGIEMAETFLLHDDDGLAHFMTRRFDRDRDGTPDGKLHAHTLGGLLHLDYNVQYQIGYEEYFDVIRRLGLGQPAIEQAFRRMVFSLATVNYDDHLKNFAFLMDAQGRWTLSPAYDVAYAENDGWTRQHQMSVRGKFLGITRADCVAVAKEFDIREREAYEIMDQVLDAVGDWEVKAREVELDDAFRRKMTERLARERMLLASG
ncbi:type II toxin-antitoxin system HipA family toxin [bacterium]|nr:type II toxin-antitoxin system HipA family toxin [bacterium]